MTQATPTEERTVEAARAGHAEAWEELFDAHYPKLYRYFRSRLGSPESAEDLAAEVFVEAYRSLGRFRWRNRPFEAWLFGIARHRLLRAAARSCKIVRFASAGSGHPASAQGFRGLLGITSLPTPARLRGLRGAAGWECADAPPSLPRVTRPSCLPIEVDGVAGGRVDWFSPATS